MSCRQRDTDLLLLCLGELAPIARLQAALHLRRCARCRGRADEMAAASRMIAGALAPYGGETPDGPGRPLASGAAWLGPWRLMRAAFITAALLGLATSWFAWRHSAAIRPPVDDGCRPGLASDRCR